MTALHDAIESLEHWATTTIGKPATREQREDVARAMERLLEMVTKFVSSPADNLFPGVIAGMQELQRVTRGSAYYVTIPVYLIEAARETGEWLGKPEAMGVEVYQGDWVLRSDTHAESYTFYEHPIVNEDGTHELQSETRALIVRWKD